MVFYTDVLGINELDELATKHNTDKKPEGHNYTKVYSHYFSRIKSDKIKLLEIGVLNGASIKMWKEYFSNAQIYGIDINPSNKEYEDERIKIFIGNQTDEVFLKNVMEEIGLIDIIIDDGGHTMNQQKTSFKVLFKYLNEGGVYVIEDLHTSYWKTYPLGDKNFLCYDSPQSTISYLKYLLDCINFVGATDGIGDALRKPSEKIQLDVSERYLIENIISIHFYNSLCFIFKKPKK